MSVLADLKALKHIADTDNSQDTLLNLKIRMAETAIGKYLNNDLDNATIETTYPDAVLQHVIEALNRLGDEGIKVSQISSVQSTYELGISDSVKALLPLPFVRMMG